jgi:hypothetical protein
MNNTNSNSIQDIVNKIPITVFFSQLPDRKQALKYVEWLYANVPQSKTVDQDQLFRNVISKELRLVSMKIIDIDILFMVALNKIAIEDFTIESDTLVKKVMSENVDKYDLDTMYRVLAQLMTKLPRDLRERVAGKHKLQMFQKVSSFINMNKEVLEKFISMDPTLNTPISMELDSNDYNTLNQKYLDELKQFEESQPYINSDSLESSQIASNMISSMPTTQTPGVINAQYIDSTPDLMRGLNDNKLYYFDSSSGTISEMPTGNTGTPVSLNDLSNVLLANKVNKQDIKDFITKINTSVPTASPNTTQPASFLNSLETSFFNLFSSSPTPTILPSTTKSSSTPPIPPAYIMLQQILNKNGQFPGPQLPGQYPNDLLLQLLEQLPEQYPNNLPEQLPSQLPEQLPSQLPGQLPSQLPGQLPSQLPGQLPTNQNYYSSSNQSYPAIINMNNPNNYNAFVNNCLSSNPPASCFNRSLPVQNPDWYNQYLKYKFDYLNSTYDKTNKISPLDEQRFLHECSLPSPPWYCFNPTTRPNTTQANAQTTQANAQTTQANAQTTQANAQTTQANAQTTTPNVTQISAFSNMNNKENDLIQKITKNNKDIENVALGFVTVIILVFLLVIYNSIRNKSGVSIKK